MRLFERCFLVKMQGKAPKNSMDGITDLLRDTYDDISALVNKYKTIKIYIERFVTLIDFYGKHSKVLKIFHRFQAQLASTIYFIRQVIEYSDLPQQQTKDNLLCITRPLLADFQEQSWIEAVAPYVDYLYQHQTKPKEKQSYETMTFRSDFSLPRFMKQMKHVLSIIVENSLVASRSVDIIVDEESESKDNESEWGSHVNPIYENKLELLDS